MVMSREEREASIRGETTPKQRAERLDKAARERLEKLRMKTDHIRAEYTKAQEAFQALSEEAKQLPTKLREAAKEGG